MKGFDRIGVATHLSFSSGNLILNAERPVRIGEPVHNAKKSKVGRVFDFFGPVSKPFISVRLDLKEVEKYVGQPLYVKNSRGRGK